MGVSIDSNISFSVLSLLRESQQDEGEVEEDNLDAAAVEVLAVRGHQGAKDRVKGEDWDDNQAVESVHGKELVHH